MKKNRYIKLKIKEWAKAILYALAILFLVQQFIYNRLHITHSQMSPNISNGDYLLINKWNIGTRLPNSLIGTNFSLPTLRLPFGSEINRFDIIAFNSPIDSTQPINQKPIYISRIIGLPGDTVQIQNGNILVNQTIINEPFDTKHPYIINFHPDANPAQVLRSVGEYELYGPYKKHQYRAYLSARQVPLIKNSKWVSKLELIDWKKGIEAYTAINCKRCNWNLDNFGPIEVYRQDQIINLNSKIIEIHPSLFSSSRREKKADVSNFKINQDYYFVLGDNRHNAIDSRYFGLVPKSHIIGRIKTVLFNYDKANPYKSVKWNRTLKSLK